MKETKTKHYFRVYGTFSWVEGYGSSMEPHRCGHPDEPCVTVTWEREVGDWNISDKKWKGRNDRQDG